MHRPAQASALFRGKLAHRPAGRDDIECLEPVRIGKAFQAGDRLRFAAVPGQCGGKLMDDLFRLVAVPSALEE